MPSAEGAEFLVAGGMRGMNRFITLKPWDFCSFGGA